MNRPDISAARAVAMDPQRPPAFPLWVWLTTDGAGPTFWASVVLALLIVLAHRANIQRLLAGTENRFRTRTGAPA